jgi:hypothetical protein
VTAGGLGAHGLWIVNRIPLHGVWGDVEREASRLFGDIMMISSISPISPAQSSDPPSTVSNAVNITA